MMITLGRILHFQVIYLRVGGEWNRLRIVSKERLQYNMLAESAVVVVVLLMLVCSLFNLTVSAVTYCSHGLFIMNMKAFGTGAPTLLLLSHALNDQLYFICCQRYDLAVFLNIISILFCLKCINFYAILKLLRHNNAYEKKRINAACLCQAMKHKCKLSQYET